MFKIHNQQKDFTEIIDQILKMILNGKLTIVITIGSVLRESFGVPLNYIFRAATIHAVSSALT